MNDIAIRFDHVGKLYKLGLVGTGTLSHDLNRWWKTTILRQEDPYLKMLRSLVGSEMCIRDSIKAM